MMSVLNFVQRLKDGLSKSKAEQSRWDDYREIMRSVLADQHIDPIEAESALSALGKSFDDLAKDAEVFRKRLESRAAIDAVGDSRAELSKVSQRLEELTADRQAYLAKVAAELQALGARQSHLNFVINSATAAESDLRSSVQDPSVRYAMEQANNRVKELVAKEQRLIELTTLSSSPDSIVGKLSAIGSKLREWKSKPPSNGESREYILRQIAGLEAQEAAWEARLAEAEQELRQVRAEMGEARREQAEADRRTLQP
ncbi:MAG: hypothetical protein ACK5AC_13315 [Planctomycetota bacterium]|jgi:chromosome segregation ATPase